MGILSFACSSPLYLGDWEPLQEECSISEENRMNFTDWGRGTVIQYHSGSIFATLNSRRTKTSIAIHRLVWVEDLPAPQRESGATSPRSIKPKEYLVLLPSEATEDPRGIGVVLSFGVTAKSDERLIIQDAGGRSRGRSRLKRGGLF